MKFAQRIPQVVLGLALAYAGIGHLTTNRTEFQAQRAFLGLPLLFAKLTYIRDERKSHGRLYLRIQHRS